MPLTNDQAQLFQQVLETTRKQIQETEQMIEEELGRVKERIADLQAKKEAAKQMYDAACRMLGVENEFASLEEEGLAGD
jgi:flagellar capping protein FliD